MLILLEERCLLTTSITTRHKLKQIAFKILKGLLVFGFWILVWEIASRLISHDNELMLLIFPSPVTVFNTWTEIAFTASFLKAVLNTLLNVLTGFLLGILLGFVFGTLTHFSKIFDALFSPIMKIIRAVPIVAFIILMYLFFNSNILPIVIVSLMVMPILWQSVYDGLNKPNKELYEMAKIYEITKPTTFFKIKLPSATPMILTSTVNALGLAWKSGVAAEVICLPNVSLGTIIWQGKGTVDYDEVYAVTITVVILSILLEILIKYLLKKAVERSHYA